MDETELQRLVEFRDDIRDNPEKRLSLSPRERDFIRMRLDLDGEGFRDLEAIAQYYGAPGSLRAVDSSKGISKALATSGSVLRREVETWQVCRIPPPMMA